jgi:hypothetical protein
MLASPVEFAYMKCADKGTRCKGFDLYWVIRLQKNTFLVRSSFLLVRIAEPNHT